MINDPQESPSQSVHTVVSEGSHFSAFLQQVLPLKCYFGCTNTFKTQLPSEDAAGLTPRLYWPQSSSSTRSPPSESILAVFTAVQLQVFATLF